MRHTQCNTAKYWILCTESIAQIKDSENEGIAIKRRTLKTNSINNGVRGIASSAIKFTSRTPPF
jgi:hypothetical protein